jgi:hypothetical protein
MAEPLAEPLTVGLARVGPERDLPLLLSALVDRYGSERVASELVRLRGDAGEKAESVELTVRGLFSTDPQAHRCICCDGVHRFGTVVEDAIGHRFDETLWLFHRLHRQEDGARVRITVERLASPGGVPNEKEDDDGF